MTTSMLNYHNYLRVFKNDLGMTDQVHFSHTIEKAIDILNSGRVTPRLLILDLKISLK